MDEHIVYVLKCRDDTLYTGYTNNLPARLKKHEAGQGAKYTRGRAPFEVVYTKIFSTKSEALREEYKIKKMSRTAKEKLIQGVDEG